MKSWITLAIALVSASVMAQASTQNTPTQTTPTQVPAPRLQLPSASKPRLRSPSAQELTDLIGGKSITIDDAVAIALATSREYATSIETLESVRGRRDEARAGLNPTVGVTASLTQFDEPIVANFGGTTIPIQNRFNPIYNAAVTLPIDIFGTIRSGISQANFREVAARIDVNRVRNDLVFNVRNAFYNALRAQGQLVVAQEDLANANTRLTDAQALLNAGTGTQFDVLTAQRDVRQAELGVVSARASVTLGLSNLKNVMGIDVATPLSIVDTAAIETPDEGAAAPGPVQPRSEDFHQAKDEVEVGADFEKAVAEAVSTRPEILENEAAISAAERGVQFARRSTLPSFAVSAGYNVQPNFAGFTPANQGSIGLTIDVPIFDGGVAKARVRQARSDVARAQTDRRAAVDAVTLEVQQALVNLAEARERVAVATVAVNQAREAFRLARLRSQAGVTAAPQLSPQIELSNAQSSLTQAETNRVNALIDYNVARSSLDRAIGRYSYGPGAGFQTTPTSKETGQTPPVKKS